jgi:broad specificity phosphatase PhoE
MGGVEILGEDLRRDVVLIRHAEATVEPDRPPSEWHLSSSGRKLSHDLGVCLRSRALQRIVTSPEEKAQATASAVADILGVCVVIDERLLEVWRPCAEDNFANLVVRYLEGEFIDGWEPIEQVRSRFVDSLISHSGIGPFGVVTHGTAIAALLGADASIDGVLFWNDLTMPDAWDISGESPTRLYRLDT